MPFVQRIIEPKYLSRSQKTTRFCNFVDDNFVVRTSAAPINNCRAADTVHVNNLKEISENGDSEKKEIHKNSKIPASSSLISNISPAAASTSSADKDSSVVEHNKKKTTKTSDVNGSGITESGYYNNSSSLCVVVAATSAVEETKNASSSTTNNNNHQDEDTTTAATTTTTSSTTTPHAFNAVNRNTKVITGFELESMCNITLSNALRQLASLLVIANNMFSVLNCELQGITDRTSSIKKRIQQLEGNVYNFDPKLVSVRKYFFRSLFCCIFHYIFCYCFWFHSLSFSK